MSWYGAYLGVQHISLSTEMGVASNFCYATCKSLYSYKQAACPRPCVKHLIMPLHLPCAACGKALTSVNELKDRRGLGMFSHD